MAGKYDTAWNEYSSIIEEGEGQAFFDAGQEPDPSPQPVPAAVPAAEPSKYDQAFSEYNTESDTPSELGAAWDVGTQRTKELFGAGLELVTRHLQDAAEKRKKSPTKTQERLGLYTDIIDAIIPGVEIPRDTPERYGEYIESSKRIQESAQKELDKLPQAPKFVRSGDWWENLKDPETRSDQLKWMLGSSVQPTLAIGAAALLAGVTTGPAGAAIAGSSGAFLLEAGGSYKDILKMGVPEEEARGTAAIVGTINAALEMVPLGILANRVPGIKKAIGMKVTQELVAKPLLRRTITGMLAQGSIEGATEALQEVVQNAGKKVYDENQDLLHGIGEAAFIGGIFGAMFGGAGAVLPQGQAGTDGDQVGPGAQEGVAAEPEIDRPSATIDIEGQGSVATDEAANKTKQAAAQAGVTPAKTEKIEAEVATSVDLEFSNKPQDPAVVKTRSETLKQEQDLQIAALESDLAGEPSSLPTYPVEELPSDTPIPYPVEEIEEITATPAMRPAQPARPPRYDVDGLVASPEIIAQPVDEVESVTGVTTPPQDGGPSVRETEPQPQQGLPTELVPEGTIRDAEKPSGLPDADTGVDQTTSPIDVDLVKTTESAPATTRQGSVKGGLAGANSLGNVVDTNSLVEKGYSSLDVPSQTRVFDSVMTAIQDDKVFRSVVSTIPVEVVNDLVGKEISTKSALGDKAVFIDALSSITDLAVRSAAIDAIVRSPAISIAEIPLVDIGGFSGKTGTTAIATDNIRHKGDIKPSLAGSQPEGGRISRTTTSDVGQIPTPKEVETTPSPKSKRASRMATAIEKANVGLPEGYKIAEGREGGTRFLISTGPKGERIQRASGLGYTPRALAEAVRGIKLVASQLGPIPTERIPSVKAAPVETASTAPQPVAESAPKESTAEAVDMAKIVASSGPIRSYAIARGHKWPMGPNSKKYKQLKAEYTAARAKYEQDRAGEKPAQAPAEKLEQPAPAPTDSVQQPTEPVARDTTTAPEPAAEPGKGAKSLRLIKMPPETVEIEETGETATIEESAQVAIERIDGKLRALYQLRDCLRS